MGDSTPVNDKDREMEASNAFEDLRSVLVENQSSYCNDHASYSSEGNCILGPYFFNKMPQAIQVASQRVQSKNAPTNPQTALCWGKKMRGTPRGWPSNPPGWSDWVGRLKPKYGDHWKRAGIYDAIMMSTHDMPFDRPLVAAGLCFWSSTTNTMDLPVGMMSPTLLDVAAIAGFKPHGQQVSALALAGSYQKLKLKRVDKTYRKFIEHFKGDQELEDTQEEHIAFLLYWLCKFVFCVSRGRITSLWSGLAEALASSEVDVALGPIVLANLYRGLRKMVQSPLQVQTYGPIWLFQMWLQVYFPKLGPPPIIYERDQILGAALIDSVPPLHTVMDCFKTFLECSSLSEAQWSACLNRTYPSFIRLFGNSGSDNASCSSEIASSILTTRDLHFGVVVRKGRSGWSYGNYNSGAELYCPNHFSRQLGCLQYVPVPVPVHSSVNWYSWSRITFSEERQVAQITEIFNSISKEFKHQPYNKCFQSTEIFQNWWETKMKTVFAQKCMHLCNLEATAAASLRASLVQGITVINLDDDDSDDAKDDEEEDEYDDETPLATIFSNKHKKDDTHESSSEEFCDPNHVPNISTPVTTTHHQDEATEYDSLQTTDARHSSELLAKNHPESPQLQNTILGKRKAADELLKAASPYQCNEEAKSARNTVLTFLNSSSPSLDLSNFYKLKDAVQTLINSEQLVPLTDIPMLKNQIQELEAHLPKFIVAREEIIEVDKNLALLPMANSRMEISWKQSSRIEERLKKLSSRLAELDEETARVRAECDLAMDELELELEMRAPLQRVIDEGNENKQKKNNLENDMRATRKLCDKLRETLQAQLGLDKGHA